MARLSDNLLRRLEAAGFYVFRDPPPVLRAARLRSPDRTASAEPPRRGDADAPPDPSSPAEPDGHA